MKTNVFGEVFFLKFNVMFDRKLYLVTLTFNKSWWMSIGIILYMKEFNDFVYAFTLNTILPDYRSASICNKEKKMGGTCYQQEISISPVTLPKSISDS